MADVIDSKKVPAKAKPRDQAPDYSKVAFDEACNKITEAHSRNFRGTHVLKPLAFNSPPIAQLFKRGYAEALRMYCIVTFSLRASLRDDSFSDKNDKALMGTLDKVKASLQKQLTQLETLIATSEQYGLADINTNARPAEGRIAVVGPAPHTVIECYMIADRFMSLVVPAWTIGVVTPEEYQKAQKKVKGLLISLRGHVRKWLKDTLVHAGQANGKNVLTAADAKGLDSAAPEIAHEDHDADFTPIMDAVQKVNGDAEAETPLSIPEFGKQSTPKPELAPISG